MEIDKLRQFMSSLLFRNPVFVHLLISNRIDLLSYIDFSIDAEKEDDEQVYQLLHTDKETALKQYEDMMSSKEIKYWR